MYQIASGQLSQWHRQGQSRPNTWVSYEEGIKAILHFYNVGVGIFCAPQPPLNDITVVLIVHITKISRELVLMRNAMFSK